MFNHGFHDLLNPFCVCGNAETESSSYNLLQCFLSVKEKMTLLNPIRQINPHIFEDSMVDYFVTLNNTKLLPSMKKHTNYMVSNIYF